jgi:hypothetical protein
MVDSFLERFHAKKTNATVVDAAVQPIPTAAPTVPTEDEPRRERRHPTAPELPRSMGRWSTEEMLGLRKAVELLGGSVRPTQLKFVQSFVPGRGLDAIAEKVHSPEFVAFCEESRFMEEKEAAAGPAVRGVDADGQENQAPVFRMPVLPMKRFSLMRDWAEAQAERAKRKQALDDMLAGRRDS